jgi:hypothetical protein
MDQPSCIPVVELFTLPGLQAFLGRFTYAVSLQQGGATERVGCRTATVPSLGRVAAPPGQAACAFSGYTVSSGRAPLQAEPTEAGA